MFCMPCQLRLAPFLARNHICFLSASAERYSILSKLLVSVFKYMKKNNDYPTVGLIFSDNHNYSDGMTKTDMT